MSCGFTAITTSDAPSTAARLSVPTGIPKRPASSCARASLRTVATTSPSPSTSAETSASPIFPAPRIATLAIARAYSRHVAIIRADGRREPPRAPGRARRRRARAARAHAQPAVRAHAAHDRVRPALGARRGRVPLRHGRQPLPRHARRLRDVQRRPQQPARPGRARRGARPRAAGPRRARRSRSSPALLAEALLARAAAASAACSSRARAPSRSRRRSRSAAPRPAARASSPSSTASTG